MTLSDVERPVTFGAHASEGPAEVSAHGLTEQLPVETLAAAPSGQAAEASELRRRRGRGRPGGAAAGVPVSAGADGTSLPARRTSAPRSGGRSRRHPATAAAAPSSVTVAVLEASRPVPVTGVPAEGARAWAYRRLRWNLGPSKAEAARRELVGRVTVPFSGSRHVLVASAKGGTGTTTTAYGLAATLGFHRGRGVVAYDNSPTRGTLALRSARSAQKRTVEDLLSHAEGLRRVGEVSAFLHPQADAHFEVLASAEAAGMNRPRTAAEYQAVTAVLDTFYQVACIDTGTDVTAPVFTAAVDEADVLVVTTGVRWDEVHSALWLLEHLEATGHADLARSAVVVVTLPPSGSGLGPVAGQLVGRVRAVLAVPHDGVLAAGGQVSLHAVSAGTRRAWLEIAATVADGFARP